MSSNQTDSLTPTILFLTHCRTASHVLERMLSKQPHMLYGADWFLLSRMQRRVLIRAGPMDDIDQEIPREFMRLSDESFSQLLEFITDAKRQKKIPFANTQPHAMLTPELLSDHVYGPSTSCKEVPQRHWMAKAPSWQGGGTDTHTNPTVLPDQFLLRPGTVPIMNFCHPILLCERVFRGFTTIASDWAHKAHELVSIGATLRWQRLLYEWYLDNGVPLGIEPIMLDADDYLGPEKESLMRNLCRKVPCLDIDSVIYTWPKATPRELAAIEPEMQRVHKTILSSDGVMPGYDSRGLDIETEKVKWVEKYGPEEADFLEDLVNKAMSDYEFLRAHRLRPDTSP